MDVCRKTLLVILLFTVLASVSHAQGLDEIEDLQIDSIHCTQDGAAFTNSEMKEIELLWNPIQEIQEFPTRGPRIVLNWNSQAARSTVKCSFAFSTVKPWKAFEIEPKRALDEVTLSIEDQRGRNNTFIIQDLDPLKKKRISVPKNIGAKKIELEMIVPCSAGKCKLDLEEITLFAKVSEITYEAKNTYNSLNALSAFLPGDLISITGSVDLRPFVCSGGRNYCSWTAKADCKCTNKVLGACVDKDCDYSRCPAENTLYDKKVFLEVQEFDSGRCSSFLEKYYTQIIGLGMVIAGLAICGSSYGFACPLGFSLIVAGTAMMAYNPAIGLSSQWLTIVTAAAGAAFTAGIAGGLGSNIAGTTLKQALIQSSIQIAGQYAIQYIYSELDISIPSLPGLVQGQISSVIGASIHSSVKSGLAQSYSTSSGPLATLSFMDAEQFVELDSQDLNKVWIETTENSIDSAITNLQSEEACSEFEGEEKEQCLREAEEAVVWLEQWAKPNAVAALNNEMQTEVRTVRQLNRDQIEGLKEASNIAVAQNITLEEALRSEQFNEWEEQNNIDYVSLSPSQMSVMQGMYAQDSQNFDQRVEAVQFSGQIIETQNSMTAIIASSQNAVRGIIQNEKTANELGIKLEQSLGVSRCACYGQLSLRIDPQYLIKPVECHDFSIPQNTIDVKNVSARIGPSGVQEFGFGWCRAPIEFHSVKQDGGEITATIHKENKIINQTSGEIEAGSFILSGIKLPSQQGTYIINISSTTGTTTALYESMQITIKTVEDLPTTPFSLLFAIKLVQTTNKRLLDADLQDEAAIFDEMKSIVESIAAYNMPLTNRNAFTSGSSGLTTLSSSVVSLNAQATAQNQKTTLNNFASELQSTNSIIQYALSQNSINTLTGIELGNNITKFRTQMRNVKSSFYEPRVETAKAKERNINLYLTSGDFPYVWYEVRKRDNECVFSCLSVRPSTYDVIAAHEAESTVHDFESIPIEWEGEVPNPDRVDKLFDPYVDIEGTYIAEIKLIESVNEFSIISSSILDYLESDGPLNTQWSGSFSQSFIQDMQNLQLFSTDLENRKNIITADLNELRGRCSSIDQETGFCMRFSAVRDPRTDSWKAAKEGSSQNIDKALAGVHVLGNISRLAREFHETASDAAWHGKLNNYPDKDAFDQKMEELKIELDKITEAAILLRKSDLEISTENAKETLDELSELTSDALEASVEKKIEVIETSMSAKISPQSFCGTGRPFNINATVRPTAYWPVILVQENTWTPFSVPYIPKKTLKLADITSGCNVAEIAWMEGDRDVRMSSSAASTELVSGRGYYMLSRNSCQIKFDISLFRNDGTISLGSQDKNLEKDRVSFFGSGSSTLPLSRGSVGHIVNEFSLFGLYSTGNIYATSCAPSRYEVYENFVRERPTLIKDPASLSSAAPKWTEFRKALPSTSYPFSTALNSVRAVSEPANLMTPGNAYFAWTNYGQCNISSLPAAPPTSIFGFGTKGLSLNISHRLPEGWEVSEDLFRGGRSFNSIIPFCGDEEYGLCAGIGDATTFYRNIIPRRDVPGRKSIEFLFTDSATGSTYVSSANYNLIYPKPSLDVSKVANRLNINYTAEISSDIPDACEYHDFNIKVEAPLGWRVKSNKTATLAPHQTSTKKVSLSPIPGSAQSGNVNIIILSENSDLEKTFAGEIEIFNSCNPIGGSALDIDTTASHIFYSIGTKIISLEKKTCATEEIVTGNNIKGIEEVNGKIVWIEGNEVRQKSIVSNSTETVAEVGDDSFYVVSDGSNAYWIEENAIMKSTPTGKEKIADAQEPIGIDTEDSYIYWTERNEIKRVAKNTVCNENCETVAEVSQQLTTEEGRLASLDVSNSEIFVSVMNPNALQSFDIFSSLMSRNVGKVIRLKDGSMEVVAKPAFLLSQSGISSVSVDDQNVYFVHSDSIETTGTLDRTSRFVNSAIYSDYIEVPGRRPPLISIDNNNKNASAGTVTIFKINVTDVNTIDALEPQQRYYISNFVVDDGLKLCAPDVFGLGYFQCEGDGFSREEILELTYSKYFSGINLAPGESGTLDIAVKLNEDVDLGRRFNFEVSVSGIDSSRPVKTTASITSDSPGPPIIRILPLPSQCGTLDANFINKECKAQYQVEIQNPEQVPITYEVSVVSPDPESNWEALLDRRRITVQGVSGINIEYAFLDITPRFFTPYGTYVFRVEAKNILFPEKVGRAEILIVLTPDNDNGLCEPDLGETPENTKDCQSNFFECLFNGKCDTTTDTGVLFSARTADPVQKISVCKTNSLRGSGFASCQFYAEREDQSRILCSDDFSSTNLPSCNYKCADQSNNYMLLGKTSGQNAEWKRSPAFTYQCPDCIGRVHSGLVANDTLFSVVLYPEYASGDVPFDFWTDYIAGEHLRADSVLTAEGSRFLSNLYQCNAVVSNAYLEARNILDEMRRAGDGIYPVNQGICPALKERARKLVDQTENLVYQTCRQSSSANIIADTMEIKDKTPRNTKAVINITNGDLDNAFVKAACKYEQSISGSRQIITEYSSCISLQSRESKQAIVQLTNATEGFWTVSCTLGWSPNEGCEVVVPLKQFYAVFLIDDKNPVVKIENILVPQFSYAGEETTIDITTSNLGSSAIASARCSGTFNNGVATVPIEFVSEQINTSWNSVVNIAAVFTPSTEGNIRVNECSIYTTPSGGNYVTGFASNGLENIADTKTVNKNIPVWSFCTLQCQQSGYSYGIEEGGCQCGSLDIDKSCERTYSEGSVGKYNSNISVAWSLGDTISINGTQYSEKPAEHTNAFEIGIHNISISVANEGKELFRQTISTVCSAEPLVEILSPENQASVSDNVEIVAKAIDATAAEFYLNGVFVDDMNVPADGIVRYEILFEDMNSGTNDLLVRACRGRGNSHICAFESRTFERTFDYLGGFILDPAKASYHVLPGASIDIPLKLTTSSPGIFTSNVSSDWDAQFTINSEHATEIANGTVDAFLHMEVPQLDIGEETEIYVTVIKRNMETQLNTRKIFGPYRFVISDRASAPPFFLSIGHNPETITEGQEIEFSTNIVSEDALSSVDACKDPDCEEKWCHMNVETSVAPQRSMQSLTQGQNVHSLSCKTKPGRGLHQYTLYARNALGLESYSSQRSFVVLDKNKEESCGILSGKIIADSMPSNPKENIADGNIDTYWTSRRGLPQYITIDLDSIQPLGRIELFSEAISKPSAFSVEISEDCTLFTPTYEDFDTLNGPERFGPNGWYRISFASRNAKCIRFNTHASQNNADYTSIGELRFCKGSVVGGDDQINGTVPDNTTTNRPHETTQDNTLPIIVAVVAAVIFILLIFRHKISRWLTFVRG